MRQAMQRRNMNLDTDVKGQVVDWAFGAHFKRTAAQAAAASVVAVLAATALTAATQAIIAGITSPPTMRNIEIVGNAVGIVGNVTITGTSCDGLVITEVLALNGTTVVEGAKAFLSVTRVDLPVETHAGTDTVSVGFGDKLGIPFKLSLNTILQAHLGGVKEATLPTVTVDSVNIENNTVKLNTALNGTAVDVFLIV